MHYSFQLLFFVRKIKTKNWIVEFKSYDFWNWKRRGRRKLTEVQEEEWRAKKEKKETRGWNGVEFFFWNFRRWYLVEGSHENPREGGALCEKFLSSPLSMMDKRGGTNSYDLYANRSASLFVPLIRSIADGSIRFNRGLSSFGEEREREERELLSRKAQVRRASSLVVGALA